MGPESFFRRERRLGMKNVKDSKTEVLRDSREQTKHLDIERIPECGIASTKTFQSCLVHISTMLIWPQPASFPATPLSESSKSARSDFASFHTILTERIIYSAQSYFTHLQSHLKPSFFLSFSRFLLNTCHTPGTMLTSMSDIEILKNGSYLQVRGKIN